jgi:hypothetical protein
VLAGGGDQAGGDVDVLLAGGVGDDAIASGFASGFASDFDSPFDSVDFSAACESPAGLSSPADLLAGAALPPRKSVTYQPLPFN